MPLPLPKAFTDALDQWCTWLLHNHGRANATVSKYNGHLQRFATWIIDPPADKRLAPEDTTDPLYPSLADLERYAGLYAHSLKLTPRARRPLVSALRGFYTWRSASQGQATNPAASLVQPRAGRPLPKAMQLRDAERLLMQPDITTWLGVRDACILMLFMGCGFRLRGLSALNESALVWYEEGEREALAIRVVEKGDRERFQPVPHEAAMLLRAYLGHEETMGIPRTMVDGDRVLFVTQHNNTVPASDYYGDARRISATYIQQMIKKRCEAVGIPANVAHPHALRHLFGAELQEEEVHPLNHQAIMGHSSLASSEIYSHIAIRRLRRDVERANPLAKMRGPLLDSLRSLDRAIGHRGHVRSGPAGVQKRKSAKREIPR